MKLLFVAICLLNFNMISFAQPSIDSRINWLMRSFKHMKSGSFGYSNLAYNIAELYGIKDNKDSAFYFWSKALSGCPPSSPSCAEIYEPDALARVGYEKWHKTKEWKNFENIIKQNFFQIIKVSKNLNWLTIY